VAHLDGMHEAALVAAWLGLSGKRAARAAVDRYLSTWRNIVPKADGRTLRARGLQPGPVYRRILWQLRAAWLDGQVQSPQEEEALLEHLAGEAKAGG
jgi:tRNA nucleotidyltransferase (CCA-adding enzyme)